MKVYLNSIMGIPDAITTMFFSKRTWTRRLEEDIRNTCSDVLNRNGRMLDIIPMSLDKSYEKYCDWMSMLLKWGKSHTTMLEFIQLSFTVEGLHRGAQDDFDAHAERLDNRIIRSSTRMAKFMAGDVSEWYSDTTRYGACKEILKVIGDYDDNICYGYAGRSDCAMFRDFKAILQDCVDNKCDMVWM